MSESQKPEGYYDGVRGVIHEGPDELNRCMYTLTWWADYHPGHPDGENRWAERGQVFRSTLKPGVEYVRESEK